MTTRPIHPLENYTRNVFGDRYASVILHGLSESKGVEDVCLSFERVGGAGERLRTTLTVTKPPAEQWSYKPLVLAAMFKLLLNQPELEYVLKFSFKDVLRELMWPDTAASRREVEDAVNFYFRCNYSRREATADEQCPYETVGTYRLIMGYWSGEPMRPQSDIVSSDEIEVSFAGSLVEALRQRRIEFANLSFGSLAGGHADLLSEPFAESDTAGQATVTDYENDLSTVMRHFSPPGTRPTVKIKATPVSQRSADLRQKMWARAVGETEMSFDTGAIASAILRALHSASARHPVKRAWPAESCEAIAENVHREVDRQMKLAAYSMVMQVRRRVYEDALRHSFGLMHSKESTNSSGARGPKPVWYSVDHFVSSLMRAIEAIEFEKEWKPNKRGVTLNRRWNPQRVRTATIKLVAAYWAEVEGLEVGEVDSGRMSKWLNSLGMPNYSTLRSALRRSISAQRSLQASMQAHTEQPWYFLILNDLASTID